jgi:hypothetical protein
MNPEQTASIFSLLTFYFTERLIFKAFKTPHLPYEELPVLADYDQTVSLKEKSFSVSLLHLGFHLLFTQHSPHSTWIGSLEHQNGISFLAFSVHLRGNGRSSVGCPLLWLLENLLHLSA